MPRCLSGSLLPPIQYARRQKFTCYCLESPFSCFGLFWSAMVFVLQTFTCDVGSAEKFEIEFRCDTEGLRLRADSPCLQPLAKRKSGHMLAYVLRASSVENSSGSCSWALRLIRAFLSSVLFCGWQCELLKVGFALPFWAQRNLARDKLCGSHFTFQCLGTCLMLLQACCRCLVGRHGWSCLATRGTHGTCPPCSGAQAHAASNVRELARPVDGHLRPQCVEKA